MKTGVFISWSGDLSKQLAEAVQDWVPDVLQHVKTYFTPDDIDKGINWAADIAGELQKSQIGLIILTPDNTQKPWINFEAGALSKNLDKAHVCTVLFNLKPTELESPLSHFNATIFNKKDFKKLIKTINDTAEDDLKLQGPALDKAFNRCWPDLENKIKTILSKAPGKTAKQKRSIESMVEEILELTRKGMSFPKRSSLSESDVYALAGILEIIRKLRLYSARTKNREVSIYIDELSSACNRLVVQLGIRTTTDLEKKTDELSFDFSGDGKTPSNHASSTDSLDL